MVSIESIRRAFLQEHWLPNDSGLNEWNNPLMRTCHLNFRKNMFTKVHLQSVIKFIDCNLLWTWFFPFQFFYTMMCADSVCNLKHRGGAEYRNTFWLVSWDHRSLQTFESTIPDVIDTFRNTAPSTNLNFVQKNKLRQIPVTLSHTRKFDMSIMSFQVTPFLVDQF